MVTQLRNNNCLFIDSATITVIEVVPTSSPTYIFEFSIKYVEPPCIQLE